MVAIYPEVTRFVLQKITPLNQQNSNLQLDLISSRVNEPSLVLGYQCKVITIDVVEIRRRSSSRVHWKAVQQILLNLLSQFTRLETEHSFLFIL